MSLFIQPSPDNKFAWLVRHAYDTRAEQTLAREVGIVDCGTSVALVLAGTVTPGLRLAEGEMLSSGDRERIARWLRAQAQSNAATQTLHENMFPSPLAKHREHLRAELLRRATLGDVEGSRAAYDEIRNIELVMDALEPAVLYQGADAAQDDSLPGLSD